MKKKIFFCLKIFFLILMLIGINGLFKWHNDKKDIENINELVTNYIYENEDGEYVLEEEINYYNDDVIAWLKIDGTNINYPVVQTSDNKYYLNRDFTKEKNSAGWVFMDSNNKLTDQNIIIYGHHRKDGIMFGDIDKLFKEKYYKDYEGKILLVSNNENRYYKIFSVYTASTEENYTLNNFSNFSNKIEEFKNKSDISFNVDTSDLNQIITLSTCHNNNKDRLVVHAYRIE